MKNLATDIEKFLSETGLAESTFGEKALNDRHFVKQLRKGRRVWPETEQKIRAFMSEYKPADLPETTEAAA